MGKKQHQSDKLYRATTEWKHSFGRYKGLTKANADFRRLPFNCCSISFQPLENPYCTPEGIIFDLASIVPFHKKYGRNPVTGTKLEAINHETAAILQQIETAPSKEFAEKSETSIYSSKQVKPSQPQLDQTNMASYSTGRHAASFTSTSTDPMTGMEAANLIIQGGDPTGADSDGKSIWNKPFRDECNPKLQHSARGMLSMANSGPNTNKSQFFFAYRPCKGLNGKDTVFGRIVGGIETLSAIEAIPTDEKDRAQSDLLIEDAIVFVNPYVDVDAQIKCICLEGIDLHLKFCS